MKQILLVITLILATYNCQGQENKEKGENTMETEQTKIIIKIGDLEIPAVLNNTLTATEFAKRLPFKVTASKSNLDFCGAVSSLPSKSSEKQDGWKNGDIGYNRGWFALFHSGEEQSSSYTNEMIIGHIDEDYIEKLREMTENIEIIVQQEVINE